MIASQTLLAEYANGGSEAAFHELVRRYVDLVYSTAVRLVNRDQHLAQDVAQTVFLDLAKTAGKLPATVMLGGWLHRHTCFVAGKMLRTERRRLNRERQAVEMNALRDDSEGTFAQVSPILDEAINQLGEADRTAILLRFFEEFDFRSVGEALGSNEDAARMRVNRALGKLQTLLTQRGVTFSSAALGSVLASGVVSVAPSGLASSLASTALAGAVASGGMTLTLLKVTAMTKLKLSIVGAVIVGTITAPLIVQQQSLLRVRSENDALRQQNGRLANLEAENDRLSNLVAQARTTEAASKNELRELVRLRGEVGTLRNQLADASKTAPPKPAAAEPKSETSITPEDYYQQAGIAKLNYTKSWMLAFLLFSQQNQGQFPTNFNQALAFLPEAAKSEHELGPDEFRPGTPKYGLTPDHYEIVYQGPPDVIAPHRIIVLREREPWQAPDGGWLRTYAFADGHSEVHRAKDGDFQAWEEQHMTPAAH
jgi:RNA polymerase sigma factor (sigma-70 family)